MHVQVPLSVDQPAVGHDWSFMPSNTDRAKFDSITAKLVTSAVVANRSPVLSVVDETGNIVTLDGSQFAQAAGATVAYSWRPGNSWYGVNGASTLVSASCPGFWLPASCTVRVTTVNLDVGDQWSLVFATFLVEDQLALERWEARIAATAGTS
jgi:hypothetical protein